MMGNEGSGMTTKQMSHCDGFIRISQYGGGMASLNVSVAAGIVLHRYFQWTRDVNNKVN
jgi:tRNA G18 (ribose-2'-O)-methylase SpoU